MKAALAVPPIHVHQYSCPVLTAELQGQTGEGEAEEAGDDQQMQEDVEPSETAILFVAVGIHACSHGPLRALLAFARFSTKPRNIQRRVCTQKTAKVPASRPDMETKVQ